MQDGLLDVCVIKQFPLWRFVEMGIRMITKTTDKTKYVEIIRGKTIKIKRDCPGPVHLDGEPRVTGTDNLVEVVPNSLKVIVGESYRKIVETQNFASPPAIFALYGQRRKILRLYNFCYKT